MLRNILLIIVILLLLPFIVALFVKKDYEVERSIIINQSKEEVFNYIKFLKNQNNYSKWASMDPAMDKTYRGTDGTVGFISAWNSTKKDVGKGEQEIIKITDGERIDFELRFYEPFESTEQAYMTTESTQNQQTLVKWGFKGHMNYPMNTMLLFMDFDKMIGGDLTTGLEKLKAIQENQ